MRIILVLLAMPIMTAFAVLDRDCLPSPENVIEESDVGMACPKEYPQKSQYQPTLLTPRIFETKLCDEEWESGSTYQKGEELFVTGQDSLTKTNETIEEVDEKLVE